jgi:hypothetical protein
MKNIKDQAFVLDMQYAKTKEEPVSERTPRFRNIRYSNITILNAKSVGFINGLEELPIENISFTDIHADAENGFTIQKATGISFHNVQINTSKGASFKINDASNIELDNVKSEKPISNVPVISLTNVLDAYIHNSWAAKNTDIFLQIKGSQTKNIILKYNNFLNALKPLVKEDDVKENIIVE